MYIEIDTSVEVNVLEDSMNILLINHYAGSPEMGMEFRPYYISREWIKHGHEVTIIAGEYSHLRKSNHKVSKNFEEHMIDDIRYVWVKTREYKGNGIKRAFSMFDFSRKILFNAKYISKKYRPDVVISSSTYPLDTYGAYKIAKLSSAKYIHEVHDMWPATLYEIGGMSRSNPFVCLMQCAEDYAYKHCDKVVSLLEYSKDYMVEHGLSEEKFNCLSNGIDREEWEAPLPVPNLHKELLANLKNEGKFIVGYFGGHAVSNNLDALLDAAKMIDDTDICFVLVGEGNCKVKLKERIVKENINNVIFLPGVNKKAVPDLVKDFDIVTIFAANSPLYRFGICMNKIFDAMMAGKPIVMSITAPETIIERSSAGIVTKAGDVNSYIKAIYNYKNLTQDEIKKIGNKGRELVAREYTYDSIAAKFIDIINK